MNFDFLKSVPQLGKLAAFCDEGSDVGLVGSVVGAARIEVDRSIGRIRLFELHAGCESMESVEI